MNRSSKRRSGSPQADPAGTFDNSQQHQGKRASVALLTMDFPPSTGGVQRYLLELSRRVGRHYHLTVAVPQGDASLFQEESFSLVSLPSSMPWHYARVLATLRPCITIVGHAHPRMLLPAALLSRRRFIGLAHGSDYEVAQHRWHAPIFNRLLTCAQPLVVGSRNISLRLNALGLANLEVVHPATDPHVFSPSEIPGTGPPVILSVCRLVPRKGLDIVLKALPSLLESFPRLQYWIAGDGPQRTALGRLAQTLKVDHAVSFLGDLSHIKSSGNIPHLPELYRQASIFVLPTRVDSETGPEGFGIVYLEASASGLPVVAARSGGAAEAVLENETGLLVPPDDPPALTEALSRLLNDSEMRQRLGRAGRRWVEREMNWDRVGRQFLSIIDRAL